MNECIDTSAVREKDLTSYDHLEHGWLARANLDKLTTTFDVLSWHVVSYLLECIDENATMETSPL